MAGGNLDLFTRCSRCETVFRVTTRDLQASGGQVRCGRCQTVFDAFASLTARPPSQPRVDATAESSEPPRSEDEATDSVIPGSHELASREPHSHDPDLHEPDSLEPTALDPAVHDPILPDAILNEDVSVETSSMPDSEPASESVGAAETDIFDASVALQEPLAETSLDDEFATNEFETNLYEWEFKAAPKPLRTRLWLSLSALLAVAAIAQSAYAFRSYLMVNFPQVRPLYVQACVWLSCNIGLPRLADQLDISASDLQLIDPDTRNQVELTALVRNRARVAVEYPAFELTLTNEEERVVARRVFLPDEYLKDATIIDKGLAGRGELSIRLFLDIGPLRAAGYRIYLFYPT